MKEEMLKNADAIIVIKNKKIRAGLLASPFGDYLRKISPRNELKNLNATLYPLRIE